MGLLSRTARVEGTKMSSFAIITVVKEESAVVGKAMIMMVVVVKMLVKRLRVLISVLVIVMKSSWTSSLAFLLWRAVKQMMKLRWRVAISRARVETMMMMMVVLVVVLVVVVVVVAIMAIIAKMEERMSAASLPSTSPTLSLTL
jgi:hypothetical protein